VRRIDALVLVGMALLVVVGLATWAVATPTDLGTFKQVYSPKEGSALASAACLTCHSKMPPSKTELNPYGKDVQKAAAGKPIDEKILRSIENLDSDKDGVSNVNEIKAGTLPGDPKSKPAK
jgi:cytochrome c553